MTYSYNPDPMNLLQNGSMITAVNTLMESKLGGYWYVIFFSIPAVLIWVKTESVAFTGIYALWAMALWGTLVMPEGIGAQWWTIVIAASVTVLLFKALTPAK